jgi:hypothetical protein
MPDRTDATAGTASPDVTANHLDRSRAARPSVPWLAGFAARQAESPHPVEPGSDEVPQIRTEWSVPAAEPPPRAGLYFPESGHWVDGPFRIFVEQYGLALVGLPVSGERTEDGVRCQYFERLVLEEHEPGRVRPRALGEAWLAWRANGAEQLVTAPEERRIVDHVGRLPFSKTRAYDTRPLDRIRYLVVHHTGSNVALAPEAIAREHVEANGWPGIGYHYLVDPDGTPHRLQDLTTVSFHARQFNPVAVGIALTGNFQSEVPPTPQIEALARLVAELRTDLGLPAASVRGHREIVATSCPGDTWLGLWKPRLARLVDRCLAEGRQLRVEA